MKSFLRPTLLAAVAVAALGMTAGACAAQSAKHSTPKVSKSKASYVVGWDLADQLPPIVREEVDPAIVANAMKDALEGKKPTISEDDQKKIRKQFITELKAKAEARYAKVAAKNKREGEAFLARNKKKPGVKTTASGLQYKILKRGTGPHPGPNDTVTIDYVGSFVNGKTFDASAKHKGGGPATIPLANVIPGFREGLELMQVGGHYKLYIPSNLAYGAQPKRFPPNETIIFDVKLDGTKAGKSEDESGKSSDDGS